ncbi:MAG: chromate transporter [Terrimicrobiaceae bacterium]|nr:chromate transporter [Terrimicrobiaceae bacterium]
MADPASNPAPPPSDGGVSEKISLAEIFLTFLAIGATSFGGGVVAYLRASLVTKKQWLDDEEFLAALEISQALPGLNATNMSVIVGDRLRGIPGAVLAFAGMTLPGAAIVLALGIFYASNSGNANINAVLKGVGAASVGLLLAVTLQIGHKQLEHRLDVTLVALTLVLVSFVHVPLLYVLLTVGPLAILLYRPHPARPLSPDRSGIDKKPAD